MTAITADNIIADFSRTIELTARATSRRGSVMEILALPYRIYRGEKRCRMALIAMRTAMSVCSTSCSSGGCMVDLYRYAKMIRDNYAKIVEDLKLRQVPRFFRRRLEASLAEWDEMAEDCAIGSDEEIRAALQDIGSRL